MGDTVTLYVDPRYGGQHGIARYAREVLARLSVPSVALPVHRAPTSPLALTERGWRRPAASDTIYSPGFGTGFSRARQLLTVHDLIHLEGRGRKAMAHRLYYEGPVKRAIVRSRHVLTVSAASRDALVEWIRDDRVEVHVTGNASSPHFQPTGSAHDCDAPYFLYVGNLKAHKNPRPAFAAMSGFPDHKLIAVCSDDAGLRRLAAECGISQQLIVRGGVDDEDLAAMYRGAQALLFPSIVEGFGLPVLEALSSGTQVVYSSTAKSVSEICAGDGVAVEDPSDVGAFMEAMSTAATMSPPKAPAANRGWDAVADAVDETVRTVLAHG